MAGKLNPSSHFAALELGGSAKVHQFPISQNHNCRLTILSTIKRPSPIGL